MKKLLVILTLSFCALSFTACQTFGPEANLMELNHFAGDELIKKAGYAIDKNKLIIIASFVNIDNLLDSSSLGRITSQQVASQFINNGYHVVEMLLSKDIIIKEQGGEFLLSRELKKIGQEYEAQAVVVGTYAVGSDYIYITTKLIDSINNKTISSHDYKIVKTNDMKTLLGENKHKSRL